jgi:hypothetical protein
VRIERIDRYIVEVPSNDEVLDQALENNGRVQAGLMPNTITQPVTHGVPRTTEYRLVSDDGDTVLPLTLVSVHDQLEAEDA